MNAEHDTSRKSEIITPPIDEITKQCLGWHGEFDINCWRGEPSFHNAEHIKATMAAAQLLVEASISGNDPLEIKKDLKLWNDEHQTEIIKQHELPEVFKLAYACHDLGNIAKEATEENTKVNLEFLPEYKAKDAEDRSRQIAQIVISNSKLPDDQKRRYLPLILHLINETKFMPGGETPFGIVARVIDQVGNDLFSTNEKRVTGLLEEMHVENSLAEFQPRFFYNFARIRFGQLVPNKTVRDSILRIWGKQLPTENTKLPQRSSVESWLRL